MRNDDVNLKGVLIFLGVLALTLIAIYGILAVMWRSLEKTAQQKDEAALRQSPPASAAAARPYFPAPREQPAPLMDLTALRASEDTELNSYGWIDKNTGVVRIPVDRAIEILSQQKGRQP